MRLERRVATRVQVPSLSTMSATMAVTSKSEPSTSAVMIVTYASSFPGALGDDETDEEGDAVDVGVDETEADGPGTLGLLEVAPSLGGGPGSAAQPVRTRAVTAPAASAIVRTRCRGWGMS